MKRVTLLTLLIALLSVEPLWAAGGALPTLVKDIGASLVLAGGIAIVFIRLNIPSIAAFILAGIMLGPQGFQIITDADNIEAIAQIGFVLLLFIIGLEINVRSLLTCSKSLLVVGPFLYPLTLLFGFLMTKILIMAMGVGGLLANAPLAPLYFGFAIAGSSSLLVVKLFQEHFQLDTQPGRIALTVLVFHDIWAVIVMLVLPSLNNPDFAAISFSFLGIGILAIIAIVLAKTIIPIAFQWIAKFPELILLGAMSWCFAVVAIGTNLDAATALLGINLTMSVNAGMAALMAGATIASLPFNTQIVTKVGLLRDFFITLFFVGLGITIPPIIGLEIPLLALFLGLLAVSARQFVFFPLLYLFGIDQRSAEVSSIRLAQMSEFGLVITFLGLELGHINHEVGSVVIFAFVLTAIFTHPLFEHAYRIYEALKGTLTRLGFREPLAAVRDDRRDVELAVLGLHRDASSFLRELAKVRPEVLKKTVVVDFNVAIHERVRDLGVAVSYGDLSDEETLVQVGVDRARIIVCTIPDDLLRGINNRELVRVLRRLNPGAVIISNAIELQARDEVREAGADIVYMPRIEVAYSLAQAIHYTLNDQIAEYVLQQDQAFENIHAGDEALD